LTDDIPPVGHDVYERAKKAINKKLPVAPERRGASGGGGPTP
jgi:hypothetical protein